MKRPILMALGERKLKQDELFIPTAEPATGRGHPLYRKFNQVPCEGHARRPLAVPAEEDNFGSSACGFRGRKLRWRARGFEDAKRWKSEAINRPKKATNQATNVPPIPNPNTTAILHGALVVLMLAADAPKRWKMKQSIIQRKQRMKQRNVEF